ncbi:hypothetical protein HYD80_04005 [Mycoplasmopsis bovis]|nr:hypothetical protein [Mycoplasmopsis bovis]QQH42945.1 hypothetical protein HYD80_04005 [Mycoplasmopsis bovis]
MLNKIKATKKKLKQLSKKLLLKSPTLKDKELNLNADLSKKSVTVSAKGFEVKLPLNLRLKQIAKIQVMKWTEKIKQNLTRTRRRNWSTLMKTRKTNSKNLYNSY